MYTIILAHTKREAVEHARQQGLPHASWRWPARANSLDGLRIAAVHELPSWKKRVDRHAVEAKFRHAKITEHKVFDEVEPKETESPFILFEKKMKALIASSEVFGGDDTPTRPGDWARNADGSLEVF